MTKAPSGLLLLITRETWDAAFHFRAERMLDRWEDDGGQPAPEREPRAYSYGAFTRGAYIRDFPVAVRR